MLVYVKENRNRRRVYGRERREEKGDRTGEVKTGNAKPKVVRVSG